MTRSILFSTALAALVALSGCADYGGYYGNRGQASYPGGTYDNGRYDDGRYDDRASGYTNRVRRDARDYVNYIDRHLRISEREERQIVRLIEDRTYRLLDRTRVRDHDRVYPFPRRGNRARGFWNQIDRDIDRILDRRYREPYVYLNRYGSTRYNDYYRHRRYDARRGWYDTRRTDRRVDRGRDDGERRAAERREDQRRAADRRQNQRRADRRQDRRQDARQDRRQDARQDRRQDARQDRRQDARRDRRQDARQDRRQEAKRDARQDRRQETRRQEDRRGRQREAARSKKDKDDRTPQRRARNEA